MLFAHRHAVEVEADAEAALVAHLDGRAGEACRTHVLNGNDRARRHQLEAGLHQAFLGERVADLHGGAFFLDGVVELGTRHRGAADAVAPGLGAEVDDRHADAGGRRIEDRVGIGEARGKGVDEAIAVVGGVKAHLAADRRHAEAIAVAADAGDHARDEVAGLGMRRHTEGQRVHRRDGPGAHGEDVAQDTAHAGGGALIGLDVAGVVVALHLEDQRHLLAVGTVADIDDAGILARPADHLRAGGGQGAQPFLRRFVGTMLVPHRRKDTEFGEGGRAADDLEEAGVFVRRHAVRGDEGVGDLRLGHLWPPCRLCAPFRGGRAGAKADSRRVRPRFRQVCVAPEGRNRPC